MIRRGLINVVESCFLPTIGSFELLENFKIEIFYNGMELHTSYYRQFFFFFFFFFYFGFYINTIYFFIFFFFFFFFFFWYNKSYRRNYNINLGMGPHLFSLILGKYCKILRY
jgi:hypothetical protein